MSEAGRLIRDRAIIARGAVGLTWVGLALSAAVGIRRFGIEDQRVWLPLLYIGGALLLLSLVPWRRAFAGHLGSAFLALWGLTVVLGLVAAEQLRAGTAPGLAFAVPAVVAVATLAPAWVVATLGVVGLVGFALVLGLPNPDLTTLAVVERLLLFGVLVVLGVVARYGVEYLVRRTTSILDDITVQQQELAQREAELEQLYAISRTIGVGSKLADVLPELVGRVVAAVDANVGLVLLYRRQQERLEVMSPIWVAGHTLRAEGYLLPLTAAGVAQRVFTSAEPAIHNDLTDVEDELLADLDATAVAAVPLRIEATTIGVLLVADKATGLFDSEDVQTLESLAGPSALVLNQMARYEEAREAGEKMAELAQLKTDFVSVVSHELRTPLTSIIGSLRTLARPELAPSDPNARDLLATAEKQANRLRSLIEDLLVVSRLDNQALPVRPIQIELGPFLRDTVAAIPQAAGRVIVDVKPDVGGLEVDPDHLQRIVTNLVENALKYAGDADIEIDARGSGSEVWIAVIDHGAGIPYELRDHVFDRFTQVQRPETRALGGTGLGLSIVRGLTEAMGGRVWFEPTIGGGATFTVAFPKLARVRSSAVSANRI